MLEQASFFERPLSLARWPSLFGSMAFSLWLDGLLSLAQRPSLFGSVAFSLRLDGLLSLTRWPSLHTLLPGGFHISPEACTQHSFQPQSSLLSLSAYNRAEHPPKNFQRRARKTNKNFERFKRAANFRNT